MLKFSGSSHSISDTRCHYSVWFITLVTKENLYHCIAMPTGAAAKVNTYGTIYILKRM